MAKRTIEEKFILTVFQFARKGGDPLSEVSVEKVMAKIGMTERQANNIIRGLKRTGFIRLHEAVSVSLTAKGLKLGEELFLEDQSVGR